eukprot:CAMPEP_0185777042 /NCGR_PEP_ID=MMETSP1174-20130828/88026_1 /TAXON_ID=35687 /ORGANISM="Dictyocha speculum, Strain CCMP1381" /LENGTH=362 /DNA_ID=CAMNT_0028465273 /DNA_START=23 /DNA_END=1111 /DNA_ORIENTATION=-
MAHGEVLFELDLNASDTPRSGDEELTEAATVYADGTRHGKYKNMKETDKDKIRDNIKAHGVESMLDAWEKTAPKDKPTKPRPQMTIPEKLAKIKDALVSKDSRVKLAVIEAARISNNQKNWEFLGLLQELGIHMLLCDILQDAPATHPDDTLECSLLCLASLSAGLNEEIRPVEGIIAAIVTCLNRESTSLVCRQHGLCVLCNLSMSEANQSALSGACVDLMDSSVVVVLQKGDALSRSAAAGLLCNLTGGDSEQEAMVEAVARSKPDVLDALKNMYGGSDGDDDAQTLSPEAREAAQIVHKNLVHPRRSLIPQLSGTNLGLLLPMLISLALFIAYTYYRAQQQQQHSVPQNDELSAESEWS